MPPERPSCSVSQQTAPGYLNNEVATDAKFVELGEIEAVLLEDQTVAAAAKVPQYMVPTAIHLVNECPLNSNGKIDRTELARMAESLPDDRHGT